MKATTTTIRQLLSLSLVLVGIFYLLSTFEASRALGLAGIKYFIPFLSILFLGVRLISPWLLKTLQQPPIMIFILEMVIKIMVGLVVFLVFILKQFGPPNEGALAFIIVYLIFEFLEIKRFLSILRPDSPEKTPE